MNPTQTQAGAALPKKPLDEAVQAFAGEVEKLFDRRRIDTFWDLEGPFRQLVDGGLATRLVNSELTWMLAGDQNAGDWLTRQIVALRAPAFALALMELERPAQIQTTPWLAIYSPIGRSLEVDVYTPSPGYSNDAFDPSISLKFERTETIPAGGLFRLQADRHVYDYKLDAPLPALKISTSSFQAFQWTFDRASLRALRTTDSETLWPQLSMGAELLGDLADPSSVPALQKLASYPHHGVRWTAIQALHRVDAGAGRDLIQRAAAKDVHPRVRQAAAARLASLDPVEARS